MTTPKTTTPVRSSDLVRQRNRGHEWDECDLDIAIATLLVYREHGYPVSVWKEADKISKIAKRIGRTLPHVRNVPDQRPAAKTP